MDHRLQPGHQRRPPHGLVTAAMLRSMAGRAAQHEYRFPAARNPYLWRLQALLHCAMLHIYRDE